MRTTRVILETLNALALGVWAGTLVFVGIAAALTFPMMKDLDPTLAGFASYEGEHWRLAAGLVMNPLFGLVAVAGHVALAIAFAAYMVDYRVNRDAPGRRSFPDARMLVFMLLLVMQFFAKGMLFDPMLALFERHSEAASAGMNDLSADIVEDFNELHGYASPVMGGLLALVVIYLCTCLVPLFARRPASGADA